MNVEFFARNYPLDDRIRSHAEGKLEKVSRFLEAPVDVRVTLEVEKHRHIADLHLAHRFGVLQAHEETADMYEAVGQAVDKLERQARKSRKKAEDKRRRAGRDEEANWPVEVLDRESVGDGGEPRIIRRNILTIKPMSIEEAALQLESSRNEFLVFRDSASDRVSVLYRRRDRNYGLIAPEF